MSRPVFRIVWIWGILILLPFAGTASAQLFAPFRCPQPYVQPRYQTMPVTEYRQVRQMVQRPVVETQYEDRQVTVMKPVTEQRTAQVRTVSYQNVTQMQNVTRNAGYWQTRYKFNPRVSPCQYDHRPTFVGWLNRQGYAFRSALTPRVTRKREYVPQFVTTQVPVTRRVAQYGTRPVTYTVMRMQPVTETRKVAVRRVRYVSQEVVRTQPVTVMKSVPVAPRTVYSRFGRRRTVMVPIGAPLANPSQQKRTTDARNGKFPSDSASDPEKGFKRSTGGSSQFRHNYHPNGSTVQASQQALTASTGNTQVYRSRSLPTIVRVHRNAVAGVPQQNGPQFTSPTISVLEN